MCGRHPRPTKQLRLDQHLLPVLGVRVLLFFSVSYECAGPVLLIPTVCRYNYTRLLLCYCLVFCLYISWNTDGVQYECTTRRPVKLKLDRETYILWFLVYIFRHRFCFPTAPLVKGFTLSLPSFQDKHRCRPPPLSPPRRCDLSFIFIAYKVLVYRSVQFFSVPAARPYSSNDSSTTRAQRRFQRPWKSETQKFVLGKKNAKETCPWIINTP